MLVYTLRESHTLLCCHCVSLCVIVCHDHNDNTMTTVTQQTHTTPVSVITTVCLSLRGKPGAQTELSVAHIGVDTTTQLRLESFLN